MVHSQYTADVIAWLKHIYTVIDACIQFEFNPSTL